MYFFFHLFDMWIQQNDSCAAYRLFYIPISTAKLIKNIWVFFFLFSKNRHSFICKYKTKLQFHQPSGEPTNVTSKHTLFSNMKCNLFGFVKLKRQTAPYTNIILITKFCNMACIQMWMCHHFFFHPTATMTLRRIWHGTQQTTDTKRKIKYDSQISLDISELCLWNVKEEQTEQR